MVCFLLLLFFVATVVVDVAAVVDLQLIHFSGFVS
jgi:hypothetical protein